MTIIKISELPAADSPVSPSDVTPVVQNGITKKAAINQLGFVQAGPGAITRTIQDRMRDWVSVKDFGAKGDGATDDTAAIQAAIDYCTNLSNRKQTLYFPPCVPAAAYVISSPLIIRGRLNIVGDGQFSTLIFAKDFNNTQSVLNFDCEAADGIYFCEVRNIGVRSNNSQPTGVRIRNVSYMLMKQVDLKFLGKGVVCTGTICFSNAFEELTCYGITSYGFSWENFSGGGHWFFSSCTFTGTDGMYVFSSAGLDTLSLYNANFEQCLTTDLTIEGTVRGVTIDSCRSEGLDGPVSFNIDPIAPNSVSGLNVRGCFWTGDAGNADPIRIGGNTQGISITGNTVDYMGLLRFVNFNGAGAAGVVAGNFCKQSPIAVNAPRAGITVFNNANASGALPEYWGLASWKVVASTFTATATGMTTSPTGTIKYSIVGNTVTLDIPTISGTSNDTAFTLTGAPAAIAPAADKDIVARITDNGTVALGFARIKTTGVIELYATVGGNAFTGSGTKAIGVNSLTYTLA